MNATCRVGVWPVCGLAGCDLRIVAGSGAICCSIHPAHNHGMKALSEVVRSQLPECYEPLRLTFRSVVSEIRDNYAVIGDDEGTEFCAHLQTGCVYSIDPQHKLHTRFVNSSIKHLAQSLAVHREYCNGVSNLQSEAEQLTVVESFRSKIEAIDPKALRDAENWWASIIEQMIEGNL